jgi:putative hydroxymethylpyrimidine transport system ATP-binding protein
VTAPGIEVRNLSLHFGDRRLFDNLSLTVPGGQWVSLLGASGAGKPACCGLWPAGPATCGEVVASDGKPIPGRLAWMGQKDLLYPWLSVRDNVALGARLRGEKVDHARVATLLEQVELASCADARPATLSGGMRQRAALARTLYEDRPIVLMDEPFSALDTLTRTRIQTLAATLLAAHGGADHPRSAGSLPAEPPPAGPLGRRRGHR